MNGFTFCCYVIPAHLLTLYALFWFLIEFAYQDLFGLHKNAMFNRMVCRFTCGEAENGMCILLLGGPAMWWFEVSCGRDGSLG